MASLTRNQILAKAHDPAKQAVDVPSLGGGVFVRMLSLGQLVQMQAESQQLSEQGLSHKTMIKLAVAAVCDENGVAIFNPDDEDALLDLPLDVLKTISDAAMKFNKIGDDQVEAARKN